ncbi:MAG: cyclic nucleotide-binding domain-containing protein [Alphaproteobacteria bacterium]|nr:cyclic nucleotide-binding domain-containing protein [Alphaproteobacteria bacterium]
MAEVSGPELGGVVPAEVIAAHPLLGHLSGELRGALSERVKVRQLIPGEAITREGSTATRWYVLVEGLVRVSRTRPDGGQEVLGRLKPGALFGCMGVCDGQPRSSTTAAIGPSRCLEFPADLLLGAPRTLEGRLSLALRAVLAVAMNMQLRAANQRLYVIGRRMFGESTAEYVKETEGGWVQPD